MCGLFGFHTSGRQHPSWLKPFSRHLAEETEARGYHATGFAYWKPRALPGGKGQVWFSKGPFRASQFCVGKAWDEVFHRHSQTLIGHTRWATSGPASENKNNHPHFAGARPVVLVHNGIVNWWERAAYTPRQVSACDSEALALCMADSQDPMTGASRTFDEFPRSSFACAALDGRTGDLFLWRNSGSPLHVWEFKGGLLVWASTEEILCRAWMRSAKVPEPRKEWEFPAFDLLRIGLFGKRETVKHKPPAPEKFRDAWTWQLNDWRSAYTESGGGYGE